MEEAPVDLASDIVLGDVRQSYFSLEIASENSRI
jgi:hypothetical protein